VGTFPPLGESWPFGESWEALISGWNDRKKKLKMITKLFSVRNWYWGLH
jgi:hypothetical protein